jgi:hypothetical protein
MAVRLRPFPADSAGIVSGWARTREEVIMWCGRLAGAGFEPVAPHLAALWNASQPIEYVWLSLAT